MVKEEGNGHFARNGEPPGIIRIKEIIYHRNTPVDSLPIAIPPLCVLTHMGCDAKRIFSMFPTIVSESLLGNISDAWTMCANVDADSSGQYALDSHDCGLVS